MRRLVSWFSLTGLSLLAIAATVVADEPAPVAAPTVTAAEIDRVARQTLEQAARHKGAPDAALVERLVTLYKQLAADDKLPVARRETLRRAVRARLEKWSLVLQQMPVLAQQLPQFGFGQPAAQQADTLGPELVELIEETIRPESWDRVGGNGVIRFWAAQNVLVVRQTTDLHEDLAKLIEDLH
jgi:hypothetical protein